MFAEKTLIEVEETTVLLCSFLLAAMSLLLARRLCARLARGRAHLPLGGAWCREKRPEGHPNALDNRTCDMQHFCTPPPKGAKLQWRFRMSLGEAGPGKAVWQPNGPGGPASPVESRGF